MQIKRIAAVLVILGMLFSLSSCKNKRAKNADKTIDYNLSAEPATLDPQIASDSPSIIVTGALFEGLVRLDSNGNAIPGVALNWEHNNDSTEFTFHLRKNAKWTDNDSTPVTANDFVYAFRRALDPQTGSKTCSPMFCIKNARDINNGKMSADKLGVTAKDAQTLVITLEYSYPDFLKLTANAAFMPCNEKFFTSTSGRYGLESKYIIGNGPFKIDGKYGWEHGKYLNLKRSGTYSGEKKPLPAKVDFSIGDKSVDVSDPVSALENGTVDAISLSASQAEKAKKDGCTLVSFEDTTWGLCFNTQSDLMKNVNIRKAFLESFNRAKVLSHLPSNVSKAESILLPSAKLLDRTYISEYGGPFYLKQSKNSGSLLKEGLNELGLKQIEPISVLCPNSGNADLMLNEMIVSWNSQFNNYFNMEMLDDSKLMSQVESGNYQIAVYPLTVSGGNDFSVLSKFSSNSSSNPANYKDSSYDSLLNEAENKDRKDAVSSYAAAEKYLNDDAVFYPLYYGKHFYAMAKGVSGITFRPDQSGIDFINAGKE